MSTATISTRTNGPARRRCRRVGLALLCDRARPAPPADDPRPRPRPSPLEAWVPREYAED